MGGKMLFIVLGRLKFKPTKKSLESAAKIMKDMEKEGVKFKAMHWTLGRYDIAHIVEAPNEKALMKAMVMISDMASTETLVAITREEALKLVE